MRRWAIPGALLAVAVGSFAMAARATAPAGAADSASTAELRTPVLSARRAADALSRVHSLVVLHAGIGSALADPAVAGARQSTCLRVDAGGRPLIDRAGAQELIPASNLKIFTALAALTKLGPAARFTTEVRSDRPAVGGVVEGNLYLVGGGDPLLQTTDYNVSLHDDQLPDDGYTHLEDVAKAVVAAGITEVKGAVVGDESRYDSQRYVPTWKPSYTSDSEVGPLSALELNDGFVQFQPSKIVAAPEPAVLAAGALNALLVKAGVKVGGEPARGVAPVGAVSVASVQSPPMTTIVGEMLRASDNNTAELLTKEMGKRFGSGGTTAAGVAVTRQTLLEAGLPVDQLAAVDGSGLDRSDRATCGLLLAAVEKAGVDSDLVAGLPVAGRSGTLRKRFAGTPAAGRVLAKTGSLEHVTALTGYVTGVPTPLAFSLVANGVPTDAAGRALQDRVIAALAGFPAGPPAQALAPLPVAIASPLP